MGRGAERKIAQNAIFRGKRHDNKILKVNILLSRNFVVMAQAPKLVYEILRRVCRFVGGEGVAAGVGTGGKRTSSRNIHAFPKPLCFLCVTITAQTHYRIIICLSYPRSENITYSKNSLNFKKLRFAHVIPPKNPSFPRISAGS